MSQNNQFLEMCKKNWMDISNHNYNSSIIISFCECTTAHFKTNEEKCQYCGSKLSSYSYFEVPFYRTLISFIEHKCYSIEIIPGTYNFTRDQLKDIRFSYDPLENLSFTISQKSLNGEFYLKTHHYEYKCDITNKRINNQRIISVFKRDNLVKTKNWLEIEYKRYLQSKILKLPSDMVKLPSDIVELPDIQHNIKKQLPQNPLNSKEQSEEIQFLTEIAEFWTKQDRRPHKYDGKCGQWLSLQIENKHNNQLDSTIKKLIEDKLKVFKFTWNLTQLEKHYETLEKIVKYANKHKRLPYRAKDSDKETIQFGNWICNRKSTYNAGLKNKPNKNGKVTQLDKGLIQAIQTQLEPFGFVWNRLELHQIKLNQLQDYCIKHKKLPTAIKGSGEYAKQSRFLANWLRTRKLAEIQGKLDEQIKSGINDVKEYTTELYTKETEITINWSIDQAKGCDITELIKELQYFADLE